MEDLEKVPESGRDNSARAWLNYSRGDWIGILGIILGLIVSSFFWWVSERSREIRMASNPIVTQIVNKGLASNLDVKYKGQEIKDDLFAIQIAIWNAGKEPVRREDILSDIMVVIPDGLQVLESSVVKTTRPEIAFEVRQVANDRRYRLDWRILEKDDGGVVQFLCLGDKTLAVSLIGTVVGQGNLTQDQLRQSARSWLFRSAKRSDSNPFKTNSVFVNVGWGTVVLGVLASALGVRRIYRARKAQVKADAFRTTVLLGVGCSYVVLGVLWLLVMTAESPFGF